MLIYLFCTNFSKTHSAAINLRKKYTCTNSIQEADLCVVLGGDGTLLKALHQICNQKILYKKIIGFHFGSHGNLMNQYYTDCPLHNIHCSQNYFKRIISPLKIKVQKSDKTIHYGFSFNEVSFFRREMHAVDLKLQYRNHIFDIKGDGMLISTPLGSSGYNSTCGGPILSNDSEALVMTPINNPKHALTNSIVLSNKNTVEVSSQTNARKVDCFCDYKKIENINKAAIVYDTNYKYTLYYVRDKL